MSSRWWVAAGVLALGVLGSGRASAAPPTDAEAELLTTFAPIIAVRAQAEPCGDGERFRPVAVDAVLGRDDVVLRDAGGAIVVTGPTVEDLAGGGEDLWLDMPGDTLDPGCDYEQWADSLGASPAIYGRLTEQDGQLVAQYWFFWVYNQWNDVHEGDWEMAQLVFDTDSVATALERGPVTYAFAQHEGSEYATVGDNDDKLVLDGVRPVVFAAQGSHASFFSSSRWFGKSGATGFGCDNTSALVERVDPELIMLPGDDVPTEGPFAWLSYGGHWGEKAPSFNNGPTGPVSKSQWSAPVTWVADEGRDTAVALPFAGSDATAAFCTLSAKGSMLFIELLDHPVLVAGLLVVAVAAIVLVVRGSSRGVLGRAARAWLADARRQLRIGVLVFAGVAVSGAVQWALLRWTPLGTLVELLGDSSAWVLPLVAVIGLAVSLPIVSWVGAAAIHASARTESERAIVDVARRRRPMIWSGLVMLIVTELAVFVFPPLVVLVSRWLAAPVLADRDGATTRDALGASHRLVRGHGWRALGMIVTILLVASTAGVVGAFVLLLTSLTFAVAGVIVALASVVLVPYLALVLVEFTADLVAGDDGTAALRST